MFGVVFILLLLLCPNTAETVLADDDLIQKIRTSVSTSMSSVGVWNSPPNSWSSDNVIDNVFYGDPNTCRCCAGTNGTEVPWLQIDLGRMYTIRAIKIFGRTDGKNSEQFNQADIFVSRHSMVTASGSHIYSGNPNDGSNSYVIPLKPPTLFRYLMIKRSTVGYMTICEVKVIEAVDVDDLIQKKRKQVSTSMSSIGTRDAPQNTTWISSNTIDNVILGDPNSCRCCAGTTGNESPWLQINLGRIYTISLIKVYGRTDGSDEKQFQNLSVFVSNESMETIGGHLLYNGNPNHDSYTYLLPLKPFLSFHFLMIRRFTPSVMTICEVKVTEKNLNLCDRLRYKAVTSQSSVFDDTNDYQSFNAIDGKDNYDIDTCKCCSVTKAAPSPSWWQIDLGNKYTVDKVKIHGRQTGNPEQLQNASIFAANISMENDFNSGHKLFMVKTVLQSIYQLQTPVTAQFFIVRLLNNILTLCEVKLFEKVATCETGRYGGACSLRCHCADKEVCNALTGDCETPRCLPGWIGQACNKECDYRKFGYNCSSYCHCLGNTACNAISGTCDTGECEPGWQGSSCDTECVLGRFGYNCTSVCHCRDGVACNHVTGVCPTRCSSGWEGFNCSTDRNILRTMTAQVKTSMSSMHYNWTSDLAVDGNVGPDPDVCYCCSGTQNSQTSWWMVDMGKQYPINQITVFSRRNEKDNQQLTGFQLYFCNDTETDSFTLIGNITRMISDVKIELSFRSALTRYIKIQRPGILTLCEVLVYKGECQIGNFGDECSRNCHCADDLPCDVITGHCQSPACKTGWIGLACNKQCPPDTFGDECTEKCFCAEGTCTNTHGICHGKCRRGYTGSHCNEVDIMTTQNQTDVQSSSVEHSATIGGAIGGTAAVLVAVIAILVVVFRSRKRNRKDSKNDYETPNITESQIDTQYETLDNTNDNQGQSDNNYDNEIVSSAL